MSCSASAARRALVSLFLAVMLALILIMLARPVPQAPALADDDDSAGDDDDSGRYDRLPPVPKD